MMATPVAVAAASTAFIEVCTRHHAGRTIQTEDAAPMSAKPGAE